MFAVRLIVACCVVHSITCFRRPRDPENCEPDPTTLVLELDEHVENTKSVGEPPAPEQDADGKLEDVKSIGETHVIGFYPLGSEYPMTGSVTCVEVAFPVTPLIVIDGFVELHTSKSMLQASNYYYDEFNVNVNVKFFMGVLKFSVGLYGRVQAETFTKGAETNFFLLTQRSLVRFAKNSVMKNPKHVQALTHHAEHLSLLNLQLGPRDEKTANREQVAAGLLEALRQVGPGIHEVFSSFRATSTGLWALLREHAQRDSPPDLRNIIKGIKPTYVGRTPAHLSNVKIFEGYLRTIVLKMVHDIARVIAEAFFFGSGKDNMNVYRRNDKGDAIVSSQDQTTRNYYLQSYLFCVNNCDEYCDLAPVWFEKNETKVFATYLCHNLETWKDPAFTNVPLKQESLKIADPCNLDGLGETKDKCEDPERTSGSGVQCVFLPDEVVGWRCCSTSDVGLVHKQRRCGTTRHGLAKINKDITDASGKWLRNPWFPNVYKDLRHCNLKNPKACMKYFSSQDKYGCKSNDFSSCLFRVPLAVANAFPAIFSAFRDFFDYLDATVFNQVATSRNFTAATALSCKQDVSCVTELLSMDLPDMNVIRNVMYEFEKIVLNDDVFPQPRDGSKDTYDYESWALSEWKSPFAGNKAVPKQTTFKTSVRRFKCGICKESNLPSCFSVDLFTYPVLRQRACRFMNRCSDDVVLRHTCKTNVSHREYLAANPDASGQDFTCDVPLRAFTIAEMASTRIQLAENVCSELIESIELGTPLGNKCSRCEGGRAPNCLKMNAPRKSNSFKKCQFVNSCTETPFILYHSCSRGLSSASLLPGQDLECDMPQESHSSDFDAQDRCAGLIKSIKPDVASHTKARFDEKCPSCTDSGVFPSVAECLSLSLNDKETHCVVSWKQGLHGSSKCIGANPELPPAVQILHHCVHGNGALRGEAYVYPLGKGTWECPLEIAEEFAASTLQPNPLALSACADIIAEVRPYGINGLDLPSCLYFSLSKPFLTNAKRAISDAGAGTLWECTLTNECDNEMFAIATANEDMRLGGAKKNMNFDVIAPNELAAWDACFRGSSAEGNFSAGDQDASEYTQGEKSPSFRRQKFHSFVETASEGGSIEVTLPESESVSEGGGSYNTWPDSPSQSTKDIGESFQIRTREEKIPLAYVAEAPDEPNSGISFAILEFVDRKARLVEDVLAEADRVAKSALSEVACGTKTTKPNNTRIRCATVTLSLAVTLQLGTPEAIESRCLGPKFSVGTRLDVLAPRPSYKFRGMSLLSQSMVQQTANLANEVLGTFFDKIRWDLVADNPRDTLAETEQVQHSYVLPFDFTWSVFSPVPLPLTFEVNYYSSPWNREGRTLPAGLSAFLTITLPIPVCPCFLPPETLLDFIASIFKKIYYLFVTAMSKVREILQNIWSQVRDHVKSAVNWALDKIRKAREELNKYFKDLLNWLKERLGSIKENMDLPQIKDVLLKVTDLSKTKFKRVNIIASIVGSPSCDDVEGCNFNRHAVSLELQCINSAGYFMVSSPWGSIGGVRYMVTKFDLGTFLNQIVYALGALRSIPDNSTMLERAQHIAIIAGTALKQSHVLLYMQSTFMNNLIVGITEEGIQELNIASAPYAEAVQSYAGEPENTAASTMENAQQMLETAQETAESVANTHETAKEVHDTIANAQAIAKEAQENPTVLLSEMSHVPDYALSGAREDFADLLSEASKNVQDSALAGAQDMSAQAHGTGLQIQESSVAVAQNPASIGDGFSDVENHVLAAHVATADVGDQVAALADFVAELESPYAEKVGDALTEAMFGDTTQLETLRAEIARNDDLPPGIKNQLLDRIDAVLAESERLMDSKDRIQKLVDHLAAGKVLEFGSGKIMGRK
eukprot:TRINITY_DN815_c0_g2_i5.p1 TRINITY_DN815_c0_g2~~TRINITY_DN815_c0_g2_i5.p1  ORF type:complete len:1864 (-),score=204.72 TRINITY_DN815_c0_g2_i5:454-6045(-)